MSRCASCGTMILFGGTKSEGLRYCNAKCQRYGAVAALAQHVPAEVVREHAAKLHAGPCPRCGGAGPVDVHVSHRVWAALAVTCWSSRPHVACRACGSKARLADAAYSLFLGWWSGWGLVLTPVQVVRNLAGLIPRRSAGADSPALAQMVRFQLAARAAEAGAHPNLGDRRAA